MYGKQTECAIAAMGRLAEIYDNGQTRLSAAQIAEARGLQKPSVAKCLATLSQAGLVDGAPGPGGGFTLGRHPSRIKLRHVFELFEHAPDYRICPFGGGKCGEGVSCPLHDQLAAVRGAFDDFLDDTSLEVFRAAFQEQGWRPQKIRLPKRGSASRPARSATRPRKS